MRAVASHPEPAYRGCVPDSAVARGPETVDLWAGLGQARRAHAGELLDGGWGSKERRRDQLSQRPGLRPPPGGRGRPFPTSGPVGAGHRADPRVASVRKEGAGPRRPAALSWASPSKGDRGPCGSPAFRSTGPERGTEHRAPTGPRCLPGTRAKSGGLGVLAWMPPTHAWSHLGSKDLSPSTGSPRLLGPKAPPGPSCECQVTSHHYSEPQCPRAALDEGPDAPRAGPLRQDPVLGASESQARGSDPMAARGWDSQFPPRGPVEPFGLPSTRNRPVLLPGHLPGCRRPWASAEWDRSSGLVSPRNHANPGP